MRCRTKDVGVKRTEKWGGDEMGKENEVIRTIRTMR